MSQRMIPVESAESRIEDIAREIQELEAERRVLQRFLSTAVQVRATYRQPVVPSATKPTDLFEGGESPTEAVLSYIKTNPGRSGKEIVAAVLGRIDSKSKDPRRMIYSLLSTMARRGKLKKEGSVYRLGG